MGVSLTLDAGSVVEHFTAAGSLVNLCALDMSKAFDRVNHYALWIKLTDRSVSLTFLRTFMHSYGLCFAVVQWDNVFSAVYHLQCCVRQGGVQCCHQYYLPCM